MGPRSGSSPYPANTLFSAQCIMHVDHVFYSARSMMIHTDQGAADFFEVTCAYFWSGFRTYLHRFRPLPSSPFSSSDTCSPACCICDSMMYCWWVVWFLSGVYSLPLLQYCAQWISVLGMCKARRESACVDAFKFSKGSPWSSCNSRSLCSMLYGRSIDTYPLASVHRHPCSLCRALRASMYLPSHIPSSLA